MKKISIFQRMSFSSLFLTNKDGTLSPRTKISIVGVSGILQKRDIIKKLRLSDRTHIHDYVNTAVKVRYLKNETVIMGFA